MLKTNDWSIRNVGDGEFTAWRDFEATNGDKICVKVSRDSAVILGPLDDELGYVNTITYVHYLDDYDEDKGEHEHVIAAKTNDGTVITALGAKVFYPLERLEITCAIEEFTKFVDSYYNAS